MRNFRKWHKAVFFTIIMCFFSSCILSTYDDPCIISGKITDSNGNGLKGVLIKAVSESATDSIVSTDDGNYKISLQSGRKVELIFTKQDYLSQYFDFVILGGEKKNLNLEMRTLLEDAYFTVGVKEITALNTGGSFGARINTNLSYEYFLTVNWINCIRSGNDLLIKCDSNKTSTERFTEIILKAEYKYCDTIRIKQLAGPIQKAAYHINKNDFVLTDILKEIK